MSTADITRVRVKFCGITRPEDALAAVAAGADAIGLVFYPGSPRHVGLEQAVAIHAAVPAFVSTVGLFVDAGPGEIGAVLERIPLSLLQFHGDEDEAQCQSCGRPYIKALRVAEDTDIASEAGKFPSACGILLDAYSPGIKGGTGQCFNWDSIPTDLAFSLILAGGLTPGNIATAIRKVRPYAVDVSGGIEARKGIKDARLMHAFMRGVNQACHEQPDA